tara:strand:+ start:4379 stop:4576 length:198 start_codon:yes stop_codon:yes gene_type:complete
MMIVGDLVFYKILLGYDGTGSVWTWKEGIGHITGAVFLEDGEMFYEIIDAEGEYHEALEEEITKI